jgi:hypothetical protein
MLFVHLSSTFSFGKRKSIYPASPAKSESFFHPSLLVGHCRTSLPHSRSPRSDRARTAPSTTHWPTQDGTYTIHNFHFKDGESIPELRLHYLTLGTPHRDAAGHIDNAIFLLHGTGGNAHSRTASKFSDPLSAPESPPTSPSFSSSSPTTSRAASAAASSE